MLNDNVMYHLSIDFIQGPEEISLEKTPENLGD